MRNSVRKDSRLKAPRRPGILCQGTTLLTTWKTLMNVREKRPGLKFGSSGAGTFCALLAIGHWFCMLGTARECNARKPYHCIHSARLKIHRTSSLHIHSLDLIFSPRTA